jgi:hypothetical protein
MSTKKKSSDLTRSQIIAKNMHKNRLPAAGFSHKCNGFSSSNEANWLAFGYVCGALMGYMSTKKQSSYLTSANAIVKCVREKRLC